MDTGTTELAQFRRQLEATEKDAHVRALLRRADYGWDLHFAWAVIGAQPPGWASEVWQYAQVTFAACVVPAASLAALCSDTTGGRIAMNGIEVAVPAAIGPAQWTRLPSFARHDRLRLPRSATEYKIAVTATSQNLPQDNLVAEGLPSFPEPSSAWLAFAEGNFSLAGAHAPPSGHALIRFAADDGWIGNVHVTPTQLTANVGGDALCGCELEFFSVSYRAARRLDGPGIVTFSLGAGLPAHAWLWLKRGTTWLDYRSIDPTSGWTGELAPAGVQIEIPVEPQANVEALIAAGEGPQVEYKEKLPQTPKDRRTLKTIAAFATGEGGTMVFGVNRDELTVTGLGTESPNKLRDQLVNLIRATVAPMPQVAVSHYIIDGKTILVAEVPPGESPPYGIIADPSARDRPEFYVRRGASTYPAQPSDMREAVLRRTVTEPKAAPPRSGRGNASSGLGLTTYAADTFTILSCAGLL